MQPDAHRIAPDHEPVAIVRTFLFKRLKYRNNLLMMASGDGAQRRVVDGSG
jgi:hypothetical protein